MLGLKPAAWHPWAAIVLTVLIWSAFLVSTRAATTQALGPLEVGLLRYGPALVLFVPLLVQRGVWAQGLKLSHFALIAVGGGFGFVFLLSSGFRYAPVADSGIFTPAMLPFFVALLSFLVLKERFDRLRLSGFALILAGAVFVAVTEGLADGPQGAWRGHLFFLAGSFFWACYTVAYRLSGLEPLYAAALMAFWSSLVFALCALIFGIRFEISLSFFALQVLFQGILSGFLATITFGYAVAHLGPSRTAAFAALVPGLSAIGAWIVLAEPIPLNKMLGLGAATLGVVLASGILSKRQDASARV
ncbi:MAG: DMT family transporter [Pseudomonadota bacterium]